LGSSGQVNALPIILNVLATLPINVMVASAGRVDLGQMGKYTNCHTAAYLPGNEAAARSDLVICNGGSATVYQALAQGCPVLGIPANMDQHLTMSYVSHTGAGLSIRSDALSAVEIGTTVKWMLGEVKYRNSAKALAKEFEQYSCQSRFQKWLNRLFSTHS
jgi:UDP:flavonoid glycosyltransferase YjiC (YdhE family)